MNPFKVGDVVRRVEDSLLPKEYGYKGYITTVLTAYGSVIEVMTSAGRLITPHNKWEHVLCEPTPQEIEEMIG
jgi:hypothetical protein